MKIGLFGLGHLGKIHFKCLKETSFELIGIHDPAYTQSEYEGIATFSTPESLIASAEAFIIASTTTSHYALAKSILMAGKHCFIEKPMTSTLEQARELYTIATQYPQLITQVGFVERYNPAYQFIADDILDPKFIEVHRLALFNMRGNDVSVVFDLMIHDLDLLLNMKQCPVKEVKATGVKILTDSLDICNARIEFEDGAVANVTASRMSLKDMRKFRIFQNNGYLSMDLAAKESQIIRLTDDAEEDSMPFNVGDNAKHMSIKSSGVLSGNAIVAEQKDFYKSILNNRQSKANLANAYRTTKLAEQIECIAIAALS